MENNSILKNLKLYYLFCRFSLIGSMVYRLSFIVQVLIETGYSLVFIFFLNIIFNNVSEIAGWSRDEMLCLAGINIIYGHFIVGLFFVWGFRLLPKKIKNGEIDLILTKPINSLFALSMTTPYFASFISMITGFYVLFYSLNRLGISPSFFDVFFGVIIFIFGLLISYSLLVIISSLSFRFVGDTDILPRIGQDITMEYSGRPHQIYTGALQTIFFYVLPVIFFASIPASTILFGLETKYLFLGLIVSLLFFMLALYVWKKMIQYYSSASS